MPFKILLKTKIQEAAITDARNKEYRNQIPSSEGTKTKNATSSIICIHRANDCSNILLPLLSVESILPASCDPKVVYITAQGILHLDIQKTVCYLFLNLKNLKSWCLPVLLTSFAVEPAGYDGSLTTFKARSI